MVVYLLRLVDFSYLLPHICRLITPFGYTWFMPPHPFAHCLALRLPPGCYMPFCTPRCWLFVPHLFYLTLPFTPVPPLVGSHCVPPLYFVDCCPYICSYLVGCCWFQFLPAHLLYVVCIIALGYFILVILVGYGFITLLPPHPLPLAAFTLLPRFVVIDCPGSVGLVYGCWLIVVIVHTLVIWLFTVVRLLLLLPLWFAFIYHPHLLFSYSAVQLIPHPFMVYSSIVQFRFICYLHFCGLFGLQLTALPAVPYLLVVVVVCYCVCTVSSHRFTHIAPLWLLLLCILKRFSFFYRTG